MAKELILRFSKEKAIEYINTTNEDEMIAFFKDIQEELLKRLA